MLRNYKKLAVLISAAVFIAVFIGCDTIQPVVSTTPENGTISVETEQAPLIPEAQPSVSPTLSNDAGALFTQLDAELFSYTVTSSGYRLHQTTMQPSVYGIDSDSLPMTFGTYSAEQKKAAAESGATYLERLFEIDRSQLSAAQQIGYDTMEQQLTLAAQGGEFLYYEEPLDILDGIHVRLPVLLLEFRLDTTKDVETYLSLLSAAPAYLEQVLAYERERSSWGLFMTENALDQVIDDCNTVIQGLRNKMLTDAFQNTISRIDGLSKDQARGYKASLSDVLENELIPAYTALVEGLETLRVTCRSGEGIYASGAAGLSYYEYRLKKEACADISVEDALLALEDEMYALLLAQQQLIAENPKLANVKQTPFSTGHTANDMTFAKETAETLLGILSEHTIVTEQLPEQLSSVADALALSCNVQMDAQKFLILYDTTRDTDLFFWANRLYPGTLYRTLYQRALPDVCLTQRQIALPGYSEGWASYAEKLLIVNQTKFDPSYYLMQHYTAVLKERILPAIGSILVNYYGNDLSELRGYYGATMENLTSTEVEAYYTAAIDMPFHHISDALGYCLTDKIFSSTQDALGDNYRSAQAVLQYFSFGPTFYNILQEQMDVWADGQMPE